MVAPRIVVASSGPSAVGPIVDPIVDSFGRPSDPFGPSWAVEVVIYAGLVDALGSVLLPEVGTTAGRARASETGPSSAPRS